MVGDSLYYPSTDGNLYRASFNGTSVGTPTVLDPYNDPVLGQRRHRLAARPTAA